MTLVLTSDYTYQFLDTGVPINTAVTPNLPFIDLDSVTGLDSAPVRSSANMREGQDGGFLDALYSDMRTIVMAGTAYAPPGTIEQYLDSLYTNYAPNSSPQPFYFKHPGVNQRTIFCKSLGVKCDTDSLRRFGSGAIQIQLQSEDPNKYEEAVSFSGTVGVASTGRAYNKAFNYGYGGTGLAGGCTVTNTGKKTTGGILTLTNVDNAVLINDTTGETLNIGMNIGAGLSLAIDLFNKTAILNGTANRRDVITGQFFLFAPGDTFLRFNGTSDGGTANVTATIRPAYY